MTEIKRTQKREKDKRYYQTHREEILKKQTIYQREHRRVKTDEELEKMGRDSYGRFLKTNGRQRYKMQQRGGKRKGVHVIIWEEYYKKELPKGWCVHHINENKKDNRIENLKALSMSDHTKLHFKKYYKSKDVWNKGIKYHNGSNALNHKVTKRQINKQKIKLFGKDLEIKIKIWKMKDEGFNNIQIGKELNLTANNVCQKWQSFKKIFNPCSGRLI